MIRLHQEKNPMELHGYSPSTTIPSVRQAVADSLNRRFGMNYGMEHIFMTTGAAGALAHALRAVTRPGDKVLTFAPFFPEYVPYVQGAGDELVVVPANTEDFQINFAAFEELLDKEVMAVLINTPNNPSGIVYSSETLQKLAELLEAKEKEFGHDIFLISDEPYREILFDGKEAPYPSRFYPNTLSC
jgi:aspartate aminotransferase